MDRELLIVAAAVALLFAVPVALLCWIAVQWAHARVVDRRLAALEAALRDLGAAADGGASGAAAEVPHIAVAGEVPPTEERAIERLDDDFDAGAVPPEARP